LTVPFFVVEQEYLTIDQRRDRVWNELDLVRIDFDYRVPEPLPPAWEVPVFPQLSVSMTTEPDIPVQPRLKTYRFTREEIISRPGGFRFIGYVWDSRYRGPWPRNLRRHVFRAWYSPDHRRGWRQYKRQLKKAKRR
jgi:hypothetical protein